METSINSDFFIRILATSKTALHEEVHVLNRKTFAAIAMASDVMSSSKFPNSLSAKLRTPWPAGRPDIGCSALPSRHLDRPCPAWALETPDPARRGSPPPAIRSPQEGRGRGRAAQSQRAALGRTREHAAAANRFWLERTTGLASPESARGPGEEQRGDFYYCLIF